MELPEIKAQLTLGQVLDYYHLQPDRNNRLHCPFHDDKTPSMQVYQKTNSCYCFSSNCKTHGKSLDVIDFIMYMENSSKHEAILQAKTMLTGSSEAKPAKASPKSSQESRVSFLRDMFSYFTKGLHGSRPARAYLQQRGLDHQETEVGYNSGQFHHGARKDPKLIEKCLQHGLLSDPGTKSRTGQPAYKVFGKWALVFPLKNKQNDIVSLYFRSILDDKKQRHFYLKDRQGLYPAYPTTKATKLILTESIIDAATLLEQENIKNKYEVLALYGTNGLTEEHRKAIRNWLASPSGEMPEGQRGKEIIFFLNGDQAGIKAVEKYAGMLNGESPKVNITKVETPENEDVNSLLQGHDPDIFTHLLDSRVTLFLSTEMQQEEKAEAPKPALPGTSKGGLDTRNPELLLYRGDTLRVMVLGGIRISGLDRLKVTLKITGSNAGGVPVRHSLDLYHARQVEQLADMIAARLELSISKAARVIAGLTTALEDYRQRRLEALKPKVKETYKMSDKEIKAATAYLRNPGLIEQTMKDIAASGIIGEQHNALTGFIVNLSRKREKPLHVMYLGVSGSGKTHLQEGLAALIPEEDRIEATGLSDQALYYEGLKLKGKILFIEDLDGAENVMYIIRELQSKGRISKRVAWRDNKGNTKTIEIIARGPVVISSCTTKERLYEDNANRCILLYIDSSREQDKKVMEYMKAKSTGKIRESEQEALRQKMQNVQRMLRPVKVYNPYAHLIDLPPEVFKPRRSLPLLLGFIETITFYQQYRRKRITTDKQGNPVEPYIQSTPEDIATGFMLMKDVLFSKSDELSKATRDFLERLKQEVKPGETFYTKAIRKQFRMNASNLKRYMIELQANGYVKVKGGNRYRGYEYKITDYDEYSKLRQGIERRLDDILLKINKLSGSVVHSGSLVETDHSNNGSSTY